MSQVVLTGQWRVVCQKVRGSKKPSNRRQTVYVRADDRDTAERIGIAATGLRYASAFIYEFWRDSAFTNYCSEVKP